MKPDNQIQNDDTFCGDCIHYAQGSTCSYCANPKQKDESLRRYAYWSFGDGCKIYEPGTHPSRIKYMKTGNLPKNEDQKQENKLNKNTIGCLIVVLCILSLLGYGAYKIFF